MSELFSSSPFALNMLKQAPKPTLCISDLDGTLFTPDVNILTAPLANYKLARFLKQKSIPFILATGRSDWGEMDKMQLSLLGISSPKVVITACGTIIYELLSNNLLARDVEWENHMHYTKVTWMDGKVETWNKLDILNVIQDYLHDHHFSYQVGKGNTFLIRLKVKHMPIKQLEEIRKDILSLFPKGLRVIFTEKLLWKNTEQVFSGDILIVPKNAGKENAVKYLLKKYAHILKKPLHAVIFGDATVDVGMLTMNQDSRYYTLSQYLINPTPLAKKAVLSTMKDNPNIHIQSSFEQNEMLKILQNISADTTDFRSEFLSLPEEKKPPIDTANKNRQTEEIKKKYFSPAQNNPIRNIIKKIEPLLDKLVDEKLSPNEVSFLGLTKLSEGLDQIYGKTSFGDKVKGLYNYGFGNLTDVLDGIRARRSDSSRHSERSEETPGQLVDGFADRVKEFMQLFIRGKKRLATNQDKGLQTFIAALSCALPSIARAQVEITGQTVSERDEKGGSMIDRTKKLFTSIIMDTFGAHGKSYSIDQHIYSSNFDTFKHRLSVISNQSEKSPLLILESKAMEQSSLSEFQRKALERLLLYIDVLQQEDTIIRKYLSKQPQLLTAYEKQSQKIAKDYLELPISKLRKKWKVADYKLQIRKFLV